MNKRILIGATLILLLIPLCLTAIPTVVSGKPEPYSESVQVITVNDPGTVRMANNIQFTTGMRVTGDYVGTLGTGTMEVTFERIKVNIVTGEGTLFATWKITIDGDTMWGTANGKITGGAISEGYFRGTHGTGDFAHIEKMGTYWMNLANGTQTAEGMIIRH